MSLQGGLFIPRSPRRKLRPRAEVLGDVFKVAPLPGAELLHLGLSGRWWGCVLLSAPTHKPGGAWSYCLQGDRVRCYPALNHPLAPGTGAISVGGVEVHTSRRSIPYLSGREVLLGHRGAAFLIRNRKIPVSLGLARPVSWSPGPLPKAKRGQFYSGHPSAPEKSSNNVMYPPSPRDFFHSGGIS